MKNIKEPKIMEVLINIKYRETEDELIQEFCFSVPNKRYLPYIYDARFTFKNKIEKLVKDFLLDGYINRVDDVDKIEMHYSKQDKPSGVIRKIEAYIPPFNGCLYCAKAVKEGDFIYCPEKDKHYHKLDGVTRCQVFRCKEEIIT